MAVNRQKVMARDMYACRYCQRCIQDTPGLVLQVDHYLAKSGLVKNSNDPDDYLTACALYYGCNQEKGKKDWNQPPGLADHCIIVRARLMQPIAKALLDELRPGREGQNEKQRDLHGFIEALDKLVMEKQPKQVSEPSGAVVIPFPDPKYESLKAEPCPGCGNRMSMVWMDKGEEYGHGECYTCRKQWGFKFG
jgi:hypothetical protein